MVIHLAAVMASLVKLVYFWQNVYSSGKSLNKPSGRTDLRKTPNFAHFSSKNGFVINAQYLGTVGSDASANIDTVIISNV